MFDILLSQSVAGQLSQSTVLAAGGLAANAYDIFPITGQSNAAGFPEAGIDPVLDAAIADAVEFLSTDQYKTAKDPLDHPGTPRSPNWPNTIGLQMSFVKDYAAGSLATGRRALLVAGADGGSGFDKSPASEDWGPDGLRTQYVIDQTNKALAANRANVVKAILHHQGEAERLVASRQIHIDNTKNLYYRLKAGFSGDDTPALILGELQNDWIASTNADNRGQIQAAIRALQYLLANCAYVSASGLAGGVGGELVHFTAASLRLFGSRYYTALAGLASSNTVVVDDDFINNPNAAAETQSSNAQSTKWFAPDSDGVLQEYAANTIAVTHDISTGTPRGVLIEPDSENLVPVGNYRDVTQSDWTKSAGMSVARDAVGIDGAANTACTLSNTSGSNRFVRHDGNDGVASESRTGSIYVKRGSGVGSVRFSSNGGSNTVNIESLLSTDAWTRVEDTRTTVNPRITVFVDVQGDSVVVDWAQLEAGGIVTSPMEGGSTRVQNVIKITDAGIIAEINGGAVTLGVEYEPIVTTSTNAVIAALDRTSLTNFVALRAISGQQRGQVFFNNSNELQVDQGPITAGEIHRGMIAVDSDGAGEGNACFDGLVGTQDTSVDLPTFQTITIGHATASGGGDNFFFHGYIRKLLVHKSRLSDDTMSDVTFETIQKMAKGAIAHYSLRIGDQIAVTVRRSSDNAEADFTGLEIADGTLTSWVGSGNDGMVKTWHDISGQGNDATQATDNNQAKIVTGGSLNVVNGKPCIQYDGTNDNHAIANFTGGSDAQANTILAIAKKDNTNTNEAIFDGGTATTRHVLYSGSGGNITQFAGVVRDTGVAADTAQSIYTSLFNGSGSDVWRNGTRLGTAANSGVQALDGFTIGSFYNNGSYWDGSITEIIVWPDDKTGDRLQIEEKLNEHYEVF